MACLLKERARKPIIDEGRGYALIKFIDGKVHYGLSIDGKHQAFDLLLTEEEMLTVLSEWAKTLANRSRP